MIFEQLFNPSCIKKDAESERFSRTPGSGSTSSHSVKPVQTIKHMVDQNITSNSKLPNSSSFEGKTFYQVKNFADHLNHDFFHLKGHKLL